MTLEEAIDEIRRRDDIINSHAAVEEECRRQGAEAMREAVLGIGPTNDDLIAVGKALFRHTSMMHLTTEELGAAAFDASLRLAGAFKKRVRAIEVVATQPPATTGAGRET